MQKPPADPFVPQKDWAEHPLRLLPKSEVCSITGMSPTTLYREIRAGRFPQAVKISPGRVGWPEEEVYAWRKRRVEARKV